MWLDHLAPDVRAEYLRRLEQRVQQVIERDGVFRVPKRSDCFVAEM